MRMRIKNARKLSFLIMWLLSATGGEGKTDTGLCVSRYDQSA